MISSANDKCSLDPRRLFAEGFQDVRANLEARSYASIAAFSADLGNCFRSVVGLESVSNAFEAHHHLTNSSLKDGTLTADERELKKLAKRVVKAVQQPLAEAMLREAELSGKPFEKELAQLAELLGGSTGRALDDATAAADAVADVVLRGVVKLEPNILLKESDHGSLPQRTTPEESLNGSRLPGGSGKEGDGKEPVNDWISPQSVDEQDHPKEIDIETQKPLSGTQPSDQAHLQPSTIGEIATAQHQNGHSEVLAVPAPITPPRSEKSLNIPQLAQGGVPWYLEPFDPCGTTIHEERWTGLEVMRAMSEVLSEIGDEELEALGDQMDDSKVGEDESDAEASEDLKTIKRSALKKRRRYRGSRTSSTLSSNQLTEFLG